MELENIVANTVLLKAREGKSLHFFVGLAVSHYVLKRWEWSMVMTAVGIARQMFSR